jgi:hypothetical protein
MRLCKRILVIFASILLVIAILAYIYLERSTYDAIGVDEAMARAINEKNYDLFPHAEAKANLIFYPGGLVEPEAYAIFASELSEIGLNVFVMRMPFNLAILKTQAAQEIEGMNDLPFILAGHSLGGASLSVFLEKNEGFADFLILLASYPTPSSDLSSYDLSVLSIYGTEDGVLNKKTLEETKDLLPDDTIYYEIEGGNHAYFGNYGEQKKDGTATITQKEQREITIRQIEDFLTVLR